MSFIISAVSRETTEIHLIYHIRCKKTFQVGAAQVAPFLLSSYY